MTINELLKTLATGQTLSNVYVILGQADYFQRRLKRGFKQQVPAEEQTMNFASYDMDTVPLAVALDDAMAAPFFGERRVVCIDNPQFLTGETKKQKVEHDIDSLQKYLESPMPSTVLVFFAPYDKLDARKKVTKQLKKVATMVEINQFSERDVRQFVTDQLKQDGYTMEPAALNDLIQRTDADLTLIMSELPKLELYTLPEKTITQAAISGLVTQTLTQNVFDLVNRVLAKNTAGAVTLYRELLQAKEEPLKINAILQGQFRLLIQTKVLAKQGYSQGKLASILKVHPYRIKLALQTHRRFQLTDLNRAYLGLFRVEKQMKSTTMDPELLFSLFMTQFAGTAA
ncbi:DNA polymerase III subunit delta [Levilactobacillus brevis]|uniref:DNA polymerase III subunit delta n=2 Tax=Levilactobacillus brevis TaxID=1580 RepID=U2QLP8_LEVBR|nr:DNA polymerase III subunit delta [Levilactobacillus brevis]TYA98646.1 DNA polymerase III subunit delta [Lactobacillus sp. SL9-6]ANN49299.1 DNA polymerase III subunit delta [Levilactobacillus brevis]ATU68914.1 DNA polymerase III subunit delta [Levilactobacillus brevis]ERK42228.1 DNA polymerase III, delta subunit [Levilactobacillus brevis ATCC 14869 = DSM 20054]KID41818.1 DNA polymerase III delta subunit [Levilactobacillus brevis]